MAIRVSGRGRRPLPTGEGLSIRKDIRFRPAEFVAIFRAAKAAQVPMSTWIREAAARAAGAPPRDPRER